MTSTDVSSAEPSWLDELPTTNGPPDLRMGLRRLDEADWLSSDQLAEAERALKPQLIAEHPDLVLWQDSAQDACEELLAMVAAASGLVGDPLLHPIDAAGHLVPEDLLVLMPDDTGSYRLVAGSLVFPNQWRLIDKIGGTLIEIHAPTDGYAELLGNKVDSFFASLESGRVMGRRNWFFHDDPSFLQPEKMGNRPIVSVDDVEPLWVRSERQTLRRLPASGAMVFTVRTQVATIADLRSRRKTAKAVASHLEAASARGLAVKDAEGRSEALISYLRAD